MEEDTVFGPHSNTLRQCYSIPLSQGFTDNNMVSEMNYFVLVLSSESDHIRISNATMVVILNEQTTVSEPDNITKMVTLGEPSNATMVVILSVSVILLCVAALFVGVFIIGCLLVRRKR